MTQHRPGKDPLAVTSGPHDPWRCRDPPKWSVHTLLGGLAIPCAGRMNQLLQSVFRHAAGSGDPEDD